MDSEARIDSYRLPNCPLCESVGGWIHRHQQDRLFGAPGSWDSKQCPNPKCGLVWLDPMPRERDLKKAYSKYYTHERLAKPQRLAGLRKVYRQARQCHLSSALGYSKQPCGMLGLLLYYILRITPQWSVETNGHAMFLPAKLGGRLLDIGCGQGERLLGMRNLGWTVCGIDFDQEAIGVAAERGLEVYAGTLEETGFKEQTFDAISMFHVIEHLPEPMKLLEQCNRLLKPTGSLVLTTPNAASWGHKAFGKHWRGLEPPRHLHLFTPHCMEDILQRSGFASRSIFTTTSSYMWRQSAMLWLGLQQNSEMTVLSRCIGLIMSVANASEKLGICFQKNAGNCLVAVARKAAS